MFGQGFFRENGDTPPRLWCEAVKRINDEQLRSGLSNLANDGLQFPPNLSQFLAACKRAKPVRQLGVPQIALNDEQLKRQRARDQAAFEADLKRWGVK